MVMRWLLVNPWRVLAMALFVVVLFLLIQIHGAPLIGGGLKPALNACRAERAEIIAAQAEAGRLQVAINEEEERRTAANATRSNEFHVQDLARALAAGRSFADSNRITTGGVWPQSDRGARSEAAATAESGSAGFSESLSADTFVAVSDPDVQACSAAVTYAVGAHNWVATLPVERDDAPPDPPQRE